MNLPLFARELAIEVKTAIGQAMASVMPRLSLLESDAELQRTLNGERHKGFDATIGELRAQIGALASELAASRSAGMAEWASAVKSLQASPVPGPAGPCGPQGPAGVGTPGERGERGADGAAGQSIVGPVGPAGPAGLSVKGDRGEPGEAGARGESVVGPEGKPGLNGKDGRDGIDGKDGAAGLNGKDGVGLVGPAGADGVHGLNGKDGRDGISITGASITRQGTLLLTLSDGQTKDAGPLGPDPEFVRQAVAELVKAWPRPKDGEPGPAGRDGTLEGVRLDFDGKRIATLVKPNGAILGSMVFPVVIDEGVYKAGTLYPKGSGVTMGGSFWIAQEDTRDRPGETKAWRLAVKRGADGKDGKNGKDGD